MNTLGSTYAFGAIVAVTLALGSSTAHAQDFFAACSKNSTGKLKKLHVNAMPTCKDTETLRVWNAEGPQGPQGPQGIPTDCHVETFPGTCQANTFAVLNASCTSGFATGASAIWMTPFAAANNGIFYLYARNGNLWTAIPYNSTGSPHDFEVQLQCCG
jgi:hypothetical protein